MTTGFQLPPDKRRGSHQITSAALTATTAAERADWHEATECMRDVVNRSEVALRQLASTEDELRGDGDSRLALSDETDGG